MATLDEMLEITSEESLKKMDEKPKRKKRPTVAQVRELEAALLDAVTAAETAQTLAAELEDEVEALHHAGVGRERWVTRLQADLRQGRADCEVIHATLLKRNAMIADQAELERTSYERKITIENLNRKNDDLLRQIDHWHRVAASLISIMGPGFTGGE